VLNVTEIIHLSNASVRNSKQVEKFGEHQEEISTTGPKPKNVNLILYPFEHQGLKTERVTQ
jgi:hypothetical protein